MTNKRRKDNSFRLFLGIIVLGIVIYFGVYTDEKLESSRSKEDMEYIKLDHYSGIVQGRLTSKRSSKGYTGRKLLTLNTNIKFSYSGLTRNYDVTNADFGSFLQLGDSIYKPPYSDSIFVYRSNTEYFFILGKYINE